MILATYPKASYVALGDSVSIDDYAGGPGQGGAGLFFSNADERFPEWAGRDLRSIGLANEIIVLARDGATSHDVLFDQLALLRVLAPPPRVITISVGGNDLLAAFGNTDIALAASSGVRRNLEWLFKGIRGIGSNISIAVATIYDPTDGAGDTEALGMGAWPEGLEVLKVTNDGIRSAAASYNVAVAEVHDRFLGHGIEAGDAGQLDPVPAQRTMWYCGGVEPNAWGASEVRGAFWDSLVSQRLEE